MTIATASTYDMVPGRSPAWGAVLAMSLCCMVLVASEFMPVSLLTPIAADLHMTEGQAGQAISVSGIFAVLTSLSISGLTSRWDRRTVLLVLALSLIVSGTVVALAPNYTIFMLGRAVLGIAIGGLVLSSWRQSGCMAESRA
jgi:predicted MFS family arabinose efflux permease